jgi:P4 family phage/plasmid primase-like protien
VSGRGEPRSWRYLAFWDGRDINLTATRANLPVTDLDAATLIIAERPGELHYVPQHPVGTWHLWDTQCHRPDTSSATSKLVIDVAERLSMVLETVRQKYVAEAKKQLGMAASDAELADAAAKAMDADKWKPAIGYAARLRSSAGLGALIHYMAGVAGCAQEYLADHHPAWLNCANGTVDLRTGVIKPHDPADLITYCLPHAYRPELAARCPGFLALVHRMAGGSDAVAGYVLRVLGYALLGYNPERVIVFLNGPTSSGKSQVLYIVRQLLSVLAIESPADLITWTRSSRNARVENSVRGMRLISINETSARMHIEEAQLKRLTGEPEINVDRHYATDRIKTSVSFLIIGATNDMPGVGDLDDAIRERMVVVPCGQPVPREQRDRDLAARILATEAEAILATLIWWAGRYFAEGLKMPIEVEMTTEYYCARQNIAVAFAADLLDCGREWGDKVPGHLLWKACQDWGKELALPGRTTFYDMMAKVPGIQRDTGPGGQPVFRRISWKSSTPSRYWV